jgi:hypothetical protein
MELLWASSEGRIAPSSLCFAFLLPAFTGNIDWQILFLFVYLSNSLSLSF